MWRITTTTTREIGKPSTRKREIVTMMRLSRTKIVSTMGCFQYVTKARKLVFLSLFDLFWSFRYILLIAWKCKNVIVNVNVADSIEKTLINLL